MTKNAAPATAAHELKTPLALIRAQLELMPEDEERDWLLSDVKYMSRQVQQLLLLTEVSEEQNYTFCAVDLAQVAAEALSYLQRMADAAAVKLTLEDQSRGAVWHADKGASFNRFWRGENRRDSGAGLGLAICQEIAVTHHLHVTAYRADPGLLLVLSAQRIND